MGLGFKVQSSGFSYSFVAPWDGKAAADRNVAERELRGQCTSSAELAPVSGVQAWICNWWGPSGCQPPDNRIVVCLSAQP